MTDKEKHNCGCEGDCQDGHDDCECGSEDCSCNTISLEMEDGTVRDFMILGDLEHEGKHYIALAEVDSNEYDIMGMTVEEDTVELQVIEDDQEFELIAQKFDEYFSQTEEEEE